VPDSKFLFGANKKVAAAFAQLYVQYEMACAPAIMSNVFRLLSDIYQQSIKSVTKLSKRSETVDKPKIRK